MVFTPAAIIMGYAGSSIPYMSQEIKLNSEMTSMPQEMSSMWRILSANANSGRRWVMENIAPMIPNIAAKSIVQKGK